MERKTKKKKTKKQEPWACDPAMDPAYEKVLHFDYGKLVHEYGCLRKRRLPACE